MSTKIINLTIAAIISLMISINPAKAQNKNQKSVVVSIELAKFAALNFAEKFYSQTQWKVFDVETYFDLNEQPTVYAIVLISPNAPKPTVGELKKHIKSQYSAIKSLKDSISSVEKEAISGKAKGQRIALIKKQIHQAERSLRKIDLFLTVLCGATEDHVPVMLGYRGLPEHMIALPEIEEKITNNVDLQGLEPIKVYYLGMFDQWYSLKQPGNALRESRAARQGAGVDIRLIGLRRNRMSSLAEKQQAMRRVKESEMGAEENLPSEKRLIINARKDERKTIVKKKWEKINLLYQKQNEASKQIEMKQIRNLRNEEKKVKPVQEQELPGKNELPRPLPDPGNAR